jgi:hypothetical protein
MRPAHRIVRELPPRPKSYRLPFSSAPSGSSLAIVRSTVCKSKNPAKHSVVLALGESNSKAIEAIQKTRLPYDKTTQYSAGFTNSFIAWMPLQTGWIVPDLKIPCQLFSNHLGLMTIS